MSTPRETLKQYFKQYATPTEAQFAELIDAFVHKSEDTITQSKIDGLTDALNSKVDTASIQTTVNNGIETYLDEHDVQPAAHTHAMSEVTGVANVY